MLLLDQNLSYRLLEKLTPLYPGSTQVRLVGLDRTDDRTVWRYAQDNDLAIVTKDSDFHELALVFGHPPKIVWLKCGNKPKSYVFDLLSINHQEINAFLNNDGRQLPGDILTHAAYKTADVDCTLCEPPLTGAGHPDWAELRPLRWRETG